ncbi:hypothetical protein TNCT_285081 [Trichonephila clavata]|uniref:Uncharacterized protein n=1 Tax=Trichonephila clavata TaxID=2740835 RepID=A0A8X6GKI8_TRICU|nr:hypothetical protein TNCT_285081 [Trichonephila clavata]
MMSRRVACQTLGHRKCPFAQSFTHLEQRSQSINRYRTPRFSTDHRFLEMSRLESYLDRLVRFEAGIRDFKERRPICVLFASLRNGILALILRWLLAS